MVSSFLKIAIVRGIFSKIRVSGAWKKKASPVFSHPPPHLLEKIAGGRDYMPVKATWQGGHTDLRKHVRTFTKEGSFA
jgi:hypothetical protein